jgi:tetratricopeptide (TPR) repeat protein
VEAGSATGPFVVTGDFVLSVFQADFQATGHDGRTDHYSTGDPTTGFDPQAPTALPPAVANDEKTRADITVHGGSLVLLPNGRDLQLDVAGLATQVHLGIDFADAKGSLQDAAGESPLEGHVLVDANDLALTLMPANGRIATTFSGTVNGVAVDGRPVHLAPGTATAVAHAPASLLAAFAVGFLLAAGIFTVLAVRKKTDKALLLARAQAYFEVGRHKAALRVCRRLLRLDPRNVDAATVAAMSLVRLGRASEANSLLKAGLAGAEHQGLLSMVEALVLFHQGDARTAAARLQEAFNAYPSLHNELAAVDLLDQLLVHVAESSPLPQVVSP